ncbi:MAG: hypothetical protein H0W64_00250 [Gammaproteobacteria bacterium]|nr:hypothetical protein [Gammaproteobacteria bacterium]
MDSTITPSFWEQFAETSWWLYALFLYLMWGGFLATRPRVLHFYTIRLTTALFIILFLATFYWQTSFTFSNVLLCLAALGSGFIIGWGHFFISKVKPLPEKKLVIPGTWSILVLICGAWIAKFYYHVQLEAYLFSDSPYPLLWPIIQAAFAGYFLGQFCYAFNCLKRPQQVLN